MQPGLRLCRHEDVRVTCAPGVCPRQPFRALHLYAKAVATRHRLRLLVVRTWPAMPARVL